VLRLPTLICLDAWRENMKSQDNNPKFKSGASWIYRTSIKNCTIIFSQILPINANKYNTLHKIYHIFHNYHNMSLFVCYITGSHQNFHVGSTWHSLNIKRACGDNVNVWLFIIISGESITKCQGNLNNWTFFLVEHGRQVFFQYTVVFIVQSVQWQQYELDGQGFGSQ
jgi:hypothetical protein